MKRSIFGSLATLFILVLIMVYPAQATLELVGPTWRVVEIGGCPVAAGEPNREPHLVFSDADRVSGSTGCNRFTGTYKQDGNNLQFTPLAVTKMACPPPLAALERSFLPGHGSHGLGAAIRRNPGVAGCRGERPDASARPVIYSLL